MKFKKFLKFVGTWSFQSKLYKYLGSFHCHAPWFLFSCFSQTNSFLFSYILFTLFHFSLSFGLAGKYNTSCAFIVWSIIPIISIETGEKKSKNKVEKSHTSKWIGSNVSHDILKLSKWFSSEKYLEKRLEKPGMPIVIDDDKKSKQRR